MTEAAHFDMPTWPMDNLLDQQTMASQDLSPHPFIASDFQFAMQEDLDPIWSEQFNWNEYASKTNTFQPYPQLCNPLHLQPLRTAQPNASPENPPIQLRDALATERALFMTPSPNPMAYPFPTSPSSDPCLSPDSSHASAWEESDRERDEGLHISTFGVDLNTHGQDQGHVQSRCQTQAHTSPRRYSEYSTHRVDEEEALTPLEMPDGSTRFTSNWLPVDPDAGFTIGSAGIPGFGDEMHFGDMTNAFFVSNTAVAPAWGYDG
ncbi:hypothetical protein PENARI_c034G06029 [Penicillium arizonense]|uniref:Uncharacterized protein n=1 Tax=Penicillium arizonense TaxID=1835702 RepID=A0A1F5L4Z1_PENAI|nr:hypothetical protein PENARI_c034G06029 [Penicillium arizonense]OGE47981.1 hypothetical protein PENARI_c034G06029 [Penicillium arizonense]